MKKFFFGIVFVILFFLSVIYFYPSLKESECIYRDEFRQRSINGFVKKKYVDRKEHSYPIIQYIDKQSNIIRELNLVLEKNGLFDKINENDLLSKQASSDTIFITRPNGVKLFEVAHFDCTASLTYMKNR